MSITASRPGAGTGDYVPFCTEFARLADRDPARNLWILKPAGSSRGRGIFVFDDIAAVSYTECVVVQRSRLS
jgi:hypothetical protein